MQRIVHRSGFVLPFWDRRKPPFGLHRWIGGEHTYWDSNTIQHNLTNVRRTLSTERFCARGLEPAPDSPPSSSPNPRACASDKVKIPSTHTYDATTNKLMNPLAKRPLSILSQLPSRPTATPSTAVRAIAADVPTTAFAQLPSLSLLQVRGAKRDTYDPSHRVRKRRHGFLSRLRSKNGRNTLKRRKLRGRNTLSH